MSDEVIRQSQIDSLSTLGVAAVAALTEGHERISAWPQPDRDTLLQLAHLRDANVYATYLQHPQLWDGRQPPAPVGTITRDIPARLLPQTVTTYDGTVPLLITAPHNGYLQSLDGYPLPQKPSKAPDGATREIATDVHTFLQKDDKPTPTVLIDNVHRSYRTPETRTYFEGQTFQLLGALTLRFAGAPLVHLDLHGFSPRTPAMDFDLILGTGHRQTVGQHHTDRLFAAFMSERGYDVYLPSAEQHDDEVFTADLPATLVQRVAALALPHVSSVQVEINRSYRAKGCEDRGQQLAKDIGAFCVQLANA